MLFGLVGKLSAVIASIPGPVIGGVFGVLCVVTAMNGFRVVRGTPLTERNMLVIGLPILMALFATLAPQDFIKTLPDLVRKCGSNSEIDSASWRARRSRGPDEPFLQRRGGAGIDAGKLPTSGCSTDFSDAATPAGLAGRQDFHCLDLVIYRV